MNGFMYVFIVNHLHCNYKSFILNNKSNLLFPDCKGLLSVIIELAALECAQLQLKYITMGVLEILLIIIIYKQKGNMRLYNKNRI